MDSEISNDEIGDIVLRLPAKSIVRWMVTCKSWYSFVKSCQFITRHLNHSKNKDQGRVLIIKEGSYSIFSESDMTLIEQENGRIPFPVIEEYLYIQGSCRGLVLVKLLAGIKWLVLLWNPSLENFKHIDTFDRPGGNAFALGFDEASNDYRVVRIAKRNIQDQEAVVDVYSLTTDSWHQVDGNLADGFKLPTIPSPSTRAIYINGATHWIAYYACSNMEDPGYFVILSFDFYNQVFKLINLPVTLQMFNVFAVLELRVIDGKLALFSIDVDPNELIIRTLVMMNYPLVEHWTELDSLFKHKGKEQLWPLICTKKGNCVFIRFNEADETDSVLYYNAREDKVYDLGITTSYSCPIIEDFSECLVLLDVENVVLDDTS